MFNEGSDLDFEQEPCDISFGMGLDTQQCQPQQQSTGYHS